VSNREEGRESEQAGEREYERLGWEGMRQREGEREGEREREREFACVRVFVCGSGHNMGADTRSEINFMSMIHN